MRTELDRSKVGILALRDIGRSRNFGIEIILALKDDLPYLRPIKAMEADQAAKTSWYTKPDSGSAAQHTSNQ